MKTQQTHSFGYRQFENRHIFWNYTPLWLC